MSDIGFSRSHTLPIAKAKAVAQKAVNALAAEHELEIEWHGNTLSVERPGVHGKLHVSNSKIRIDVSLGLLMKPFKAKLTEEIGQSLDKYLPESKSEAPAKKSVHKTAHAHG